jgi:hypothetical protein
MSHIAWRSGKHVWHENQKEDGLGVCGIDILCPVRSMSNLGIYVDERIKQNSHYCQYH